MLGERICLLRRSVGLRRAELAERLQVSTSAVGMYEQGRREPSLDTVVALSRILNVSADFLLTGKPLTDGDEAALQQAVARCVAGLGQARCGLSAEELTVLLGALATEA